MGAEIVQPFAAAVWALAARQHGVVGWAQLRKAGLSAKAIRHRVARGRLHQIWPGVYAVGRPRLTRCGWWTAAVLSCGPSACLSHTSAAALWGIGDEDSDDIEVVVPAELAPRRAGIRVHRRAGLRDADRDRRQGIPVTDPVRTLVDLAVRLSQRQLESTINAADRLDVIDPVALRSALDAHAGRPGIARLRAVLDVHTFVLTDSELERRFLPLARAAGLPAPMTQQRVNGFRVDFYWPQLGLVVETDGLRYHRTPAQQGRDRRRDQVHTAAGLTSLRFTHAQVAHEPEHVRTTLARVARRLTSVA